jgi:(1->4)-alpha-D-glucan 1-alpha-D-glucosylmutase
MITEIPAATPIENHMRARQLAPRLPSATYRLQFNRLFTFADARRRLAYLDDLGISDVYASPYLRARAESTHGYDIADHNQLNPSVGDAAEYMRW